MASVYDSGAARAEERRPARLVCVECRDLAVGSARGWRAYLIYDGELATFCPECAERELGEDEPA
jgi:hypothetical protein